MNKTFSVIILAAMIVCFNGSEIIASERGSNNFTLFGTSLNSSGGVATSTDFHNVATIGETAIGESKSDTFILRAGSMYLDKFSPRSGVWRWYQDTGVEQADLPIPLASDNTAPIAVSDGMAMKLRVVVKNLARIGAISVKYALEYSDVADFSSNVKRVSEIEDCSGISEWCYTDGSGVDTQLISSAILSTSAERGTRNESGKRVGAISHSGKVSKEFEFAIKASGVVRGKVYYFRLVNIYDGTSVPPLSDASYPSVLSAADNFSFSISGLPAGTATEGTVTDVSTTDKAVSFGYLSPGRSVTAAQRLKVTNTGSGYKAYIYQRQGLLGKDNSEIEKVQGRNNSPSTWRDGCGESAKSCFGYHAGSPVLARQSTRFSPYDSFASLSDVLDEVAYSEYPVTDAVTDIIFRAQVSATQSATEYTSNVGYIVVPTF